MHDLTVAHFPSYGEMAALGRKRQQELTDKLLQDAIDKIDAAPLTPGISFEIPAPMGLEASSIAHVIKKISERGWVRVGFYRLVVTDGYDEGELPEAFLTFRAPPY